MRSRFWWAAGATLVACTLIGVGVGAVPLSPAAVWSALIGSGDPTTIAIVRTLRLPRVVLGALVGAGLGMSGAAMQGTLRNGARNRTCGCFRGCGGRRRSGGGVSRQRGGRRAAGGIRGSGRGGRGCPLGRTRCRRSSGRPASVDGGVVVGAFANAAIMADVRGRRPRKPFGMHCGG